MCRILLPVALILLAGCQQPQPVTPAAASANGSPNAAAATFEVRDFALDVQKSEYFTTIKGRGTLVTHDPRLTSGNYMVWLAARTGPNGQNMWDKQILLRDGIATFTTMDMPEKGESVSYQDWQVLGYVPLEKAQVKGGVATASGG